MSVRTAVAEKRPLAFSFPDAPTPTKKLKLDNGAAVGGGDAMDIDAEGPSSSVDDSLLLAALEFAAQEEVLNKELALANSGAHPDFVAVEKNKEEKLAVIEAMREFELRYMEVRLDSQKKIVNSEFEIEQKHVKEKVVDRIKDKLREIGGEERPRRSRRAHKHENLGADYQYRDGAEDLEKKLSLSEREIREDMAAIQRAVNHAHRYS
eukprot:TRINITY_DN911_c0_g1_i1.p1 TRINITY_DN911_c0_g1~~TRINITY_DN911_c0_g1_i1.p1  ORF type:complete len:221 (-),score=53.99 TRINITY_DN911_c0_g1_i1:85-708(-)